MAGKFPFPRAPAVLALSTAAFWLWVLLCSAPADPGPAVHLAARYPLPPEQVVIRYVNLNTADAQELAALPGIGPVLARRIADRRQRSGPFTDPRQLLEIPGIGEGTLSRLLDYITLEEREELFEDFSGG